MKKIIIIGAGGHAKVIADAIDQKKFKIEGFIGVKQEVGSEIAGIPVVGDDSMLSELFERGITSAIVGIGHMGNHLIREMLFDQLNKIGFSLENIIHKGASIASNTRLGKGNVILNGAIINTDASIGNNCIINTGAIIEHDCTIENNVHIASGSIVYGDCIIQKNCLIDTGAIITQGKTIRMNAVISPGTVF